MIGETEERLNRLLEVGPVHTAFYKVFFYFFEKSIKFRSPLPTNAMLVIIQLIMLKLCVIWVVRIWKI